MSRKSASDVLLLPLALPSTRIDGAFAAACRLNRVPAESHRLYLVGLDGAARRRRQLEQTHGRGRRAGRTEKEGTICRCGRLAGCQRNAGSLTYVAKTCGGTKIQIHGMKITVQL